MPKQESVVKMKGTIDDLTYYKTKHGHLVRHKGSLTKARLLNDPAFARTRENLSEFGRAGRAGKLLRSSQELLISTNKDGSMVTRLHKLAMAVLKTDEISARGERQVQNGDPSLFEGFEFNSNGQLGNSFRTGYTVVIDRATGEVKLEFPEFIPEQVISAPQGATHMRLRAAASEINYESNTSVSGFEESAWIGIDGMSVPAMDLLITLTQNTEEQIYSFLAIEFAQEVNGVMYPLGNGSYNALAIVDVDTV